MDVLKNLPRIALFTLVAGIVLLILKQWVAFSPSYDQAIADRQQALNKSRVEMNEVEYDYNEVSETVTEEEYETTFDQPITNVAAETANIIESVIAPRSARKIVVTTDTIRVTIDSQGGDIIEVALLKHLDSLNENAEPMLLLEKSGVRTYTAQSGLTGPSGTDVKSTRARFHSAQSNYEMNGTDDLEVDLVFNDPSGIKLTKRYTFKHSDYLIDVDYIVKNDSGADWQTTFYSQISRDQSEDPGSDSGGFGMKSYLGAATTTADDPYKKISFKDISEENFRNQYAGGWVAIIQHYFVSAWIPEPNATYNYYTKASKSGLNIIGFHKGFDVEAGDTATIGSQFYAGPKYQYRLKEIAPHLDLTIDYGWLWWIAQPLYTLLYFFATGEAHMFGEIYDVFPGFGNWGFSIIMLTFVIKAIFFRLSATSYRSMANMRRVQPKLLAVREKHANDKQAQSKAMMELYQKEKINPLGGCLPILVQMPVFIALYWALMESVELRHAPFIGWITDLSVMDPYFVLPLLMGTTMFLQQKMNPPPPDPMQAKIMQWMPVVFTLFFVFFPAGLVVYWVSNNILSISQQWYITRQIEKAHS
ncbi:MAG: membrane protein insertase YidC [Cellvibrionales bacterium]|nr:membrane protein insertase YidC [Cellvibrionales bacterium]